jgi:adenosylhomocysteine nucleosidase
MTILVATGLQRERRLLDGPGLTVVAGGGDARGLEITLERLAGRARGLISIGIAGGLSPELGSGCWVVATAVHDDVTSIPTNSAWTQRLLERLVGGATNGTIAGVDAIVAEAVQKADLHRATGAVAVDMESHIAGRVARRFHLPFAAARVISDAAHRTLPPAARVGMRPDGVIDVLAVLRSLVEKPGQLGALIRTGVDAERSFRSLLRGRRLLGRDLCGPDVGEFSRNVV